MNKKITAIVLAAGKGSRMQSKVPKQYLPILEKPVLFYSLQAFEKSIVDEIVLVTGKEEQEYCRKEIIEKYGFQKVVHIVEGGEERYHSVYQGLLVAKDADYVLIHDGARPLITIDIIHNAFQEVKKTGACVVGMPVKDTIQIVTEEQVINVESIRQLKEIIKKRINCCYSAYFVFENFKNGDDIILYLDDVFASLYIENIEQKTDIERIASHCGLFVRKKEPQGTVRNH